MGRDWPESMKLLDAKRDRALIGGGAEKIEKQHRSGKFTARERIALLLDEGTFTEIDGFMESRIDDFGLDKKRCPGDGVVTGYGKVNGRLTFVSSEDFTVIGGTLGEYHAMKICRVMDMAMEMKAPFICINDSGGARIEEGITALSGYGGIFLRHTKASGVIPQIAVILGPCSGGACYAPAICDFIFMVSDISKMFITGPDVVRTVIKEEVTMEALGGAQVHATQSGVSHFRYDSETECLIQVRTLLSYLPQSYAQTPPISAQDSPKSLLQQISGFFHRERREDADVCARLPEIVPSNSRKPYDIRKVLECVVDPDSFLEVQREFACNAVIGLGRMEGISTGFVCNQPQVLGGAIDCDASDKIARFIAFCDCFHIPIITLVDVPAFAPGTEQEHKGIIRHGAKILFNYSQATVPKISLILRKAYGGAYIAMNSMNMGADMVYAWPGAEIAVMGAEGAVNIAFKRKIKDAPDPQKMREECIREYEEHFFNPYIAAARGYVNEVIKPEETRSRLLNALHMLKSKEDPAFKPKHGNPPL